MLFMREGAGKETHSLQTFAELQENEASQVYLKRQIKEVLVPKRENLNSYVRMVMSNWQEKDLESDHPTDSTRHRRRRRTPQ